MNFSEQPPSKEWAALKLRGETLAEVWFKPEGEPLALLFRIPQNSFQIPGMGQRLTMENLLKAVAIAAEDVESLLHVGASFQLAYSVQFENFPPRSIDDLASTDSNPELNNTLQQPSTDVTLWEI